MRVNLYTIQALVLYGCLLTMAVQIEQQRFIDEETAWKALQYGQPRLN